MRSARLCLLLAGLALLSSPTGVAAAGSSGWELRSAAAGAAFADQGTWSVGMAAIGRLRRGPLAGADGALLAQVGQVSLPAMPSPAGVSPAAYVQVGGAVTVRRVTGLTALLSASAEARLHWPLSPPGDATAQGPEGLLRLESRLAAGRLALGGRLWAAGPGTAAALPLSAAGSTDTAAAALLDRLVEASSAGVAAEARYRLAPLTMLGGVGVRAASDEAAPRLSPTLALGLATRFGPLDLDLAAAVHPAAPDGAPPFALAAGLRYAARPQAAPGPSTGAVRLHLVTWWDGSAQRAGLALWANR